LNILSQEGFPVSGPDAFLERGSVVPACAQFDSGKGCITLVISARESQHLCKNNWRLPRELRRMQKLNALHPPNFLKI